MILSSQDICETKWNWTYVIDRCDGTKKIYFEPLRMKKYEAC